MRMSKLVGRRIKEDPKDAKTVSHKFLVRGGYVRPVSAGIYSLLPLGKRIVEKIEAIIREEMNRIEGQEVLMPVVLPPTCGRSPAGTNRSARNCSVSGTATTSR